MMRLGLLAIVSMCVASAAYVGACNGDISLGNPLTAVDDLTVLAATVGPCGTTAYEHPNVCCQAGPDVASACGTYLVTPFAPCPPGFSTFPDPRTCCSLTKPTDCVASTTTGGVALSTCVIACSPGYYQADSGGCCSSDGMSGSCSVVATNNVPTPICSEPDCAPGETCPTSCPTTGCGSCPSGFSPPNDAGSPLCCATSGTLGAECFSQAVSAAAVSPPSESEGGVVGPVQVSDGGSVIGTSSVDAGNSSTTADASTGGTVAVPDAGPG